jgi:hypothetical protein
MRADTATAASHAIVNTAVVRALCEDREDEV